MLRFGVSVLAVVVAVALTGCNGSRESDARSTAGAAMEEPQLAAEPDTIEAVVIHPPVAKAFTCSEHPAGNLRYIGDALGADCVVQRFDGRWMRAHDGDGSRNEDWFGWHEPLLAPFDGHVVRIVANPVTNDPGTLGAPPAASIRFRRHDGVHVTYAHVVDVVVEVGDEVGAGEVVAKIGNNGMSRHPHVHIGAWKGDLPYQIRFDLNAMGKLRSG